MSDKLLNFKGIRSKGRPKGSLNKKNLRIQQRVEWMLENLEPYLLADLERMKPADRIRLWYDLQEFIRSKKHRVDLGPEQDSENRITEITFKMVTAPRDPLTLMLPAAETKN